MFKKIIFLIFAIYFMNNAGLFAVPSAINITTNETAYVGNDIPKYKKLEISFDIDTTTAVNFQMPYDAAPPAGITAGIGITVDGLFLPPGESDWDSAKVQPGFWFENFTMEFNDTAHAPSFAKSYPDWIYAQGKERWQIRFAPTQTGIWKYKIRATDASGQSESSERIFNVVASDGKGFIRASKTDTRYFEFDNGNVFIPVGLSLITQGGLSRLWNNDMQYKVVENKLNFFRPWLTAWQNMSIFGGYGSDRASYFRNFKLVINSPDIYGEPLGVHSGKYALKKSVEDVDSCGYCYTYAAAAFSNTQQAVKPNTRYKFTGWIKTVGLQGDGAGARLYVPTEFNWVTIDSTVINDTVRTDTTAFKLTGTNDWTKEELFFRTHSTRYWIYTGGKAWDNDLTNPRPVNLQGTAYFDDLSLKEVLADGSLGPEQFDKGDIELNEHFSQPASYSFDKLLEWAEQNGIYFKVSVEEKAEESYVRIKTDGTIDATWPQWGDHWDEYSGRALGNTPLKWYEKAYWRYLTARWSYSPSIHSWEQFNEHDPFDSTVYQLANEFGEYMHQIDPNKHLITTSFWTDFPASEFWSNPVYPNIDYADYHQYLNPDASYPFWGNSLTSTFGITIETRPEYVYGGIGNSVKIPFGKTPNNQGGKVNSIKISGAGVWTFKYFIKAENLSGTVDSNGLLKGGIYDYLNYNRTPRAPSGNQYNGNISPGTYGWTQLSSTFNIPDNNARTFSFVFVSDDYLSGNVWIDNLTLISPGGDEIYINGEFDFSAKQGDDLALYIQNKALGLSRVGKPIVWGETGLLDSSNNTDNESQIIKNDTAGVGFHNIIWSQINPSGVSALYWHHQDQIYSSTSNWIRHFKPFIQFMEGIPLNNGNYKDAKAAVSNTNLRVWGQKDTVNGKVHLWIQNKQHTYKNITDNKTIESVSGTITIPGMNDTTYLIDWWDTYSTAGTAFKKGKARATGGNLSFSLPNSLTTDIAVKISPVAVTANVPYLNWTGDVGYSDGVDPESGDSAAVFTFRIKYTESENYYPYYVRLLLNKNGDADFTDDGEVINMEEENPADYNVTDGKIYNKAVIAPFPPGVSSIPYKFEASNGIFSASGNEPVTASNAIKLVLNLSMDIDTTKIDLKNINLSSFSEPKGIVITNKSNYGSAKFTIQVTDQGSDWKIDTTSGKDTYSLKALFTGIGDTPTAEDFKDEDDLVLTTIKNASSTDFGDARFSANGTSVPAGSSVKLWFLFKSPKASSVQKYENIIITIGIVEAN